MPNYVSPYCVVRVRRTLILATTCVAGTKLRGRPYKYSLVGGLSIQISTHPFTRSQYFGAPAMKVFRTSCEKQDGAHEPECKHIRQTTAYKKRHSRSESLFHSLARCWTSCAGDSTTKAACAGDFTTKLRLHHEGSLFCIQIKHWRKGSGRSAARKKQWHCPKISKIST